VPEKKICNLILEPDAVKQYGMFDTDHFEDIFNIGYEYTKQILLSTKIELPL
jgi:NTE family protein